MKITKRDHDEKRCHAMSRKLGPCPWCELREQSAARIDERRPEFKADEEALKPREEWQR
jgi:DNA-binding helix-hairpin-helix protein with protein kinase domain